MGKAPNRRNEKHAAERTFYCSFHSTLSSVETMRTLLLGVCYLGLFASPTPQKRSLQICAREGRRTHTNNHISLSHHPICRKQARRHVAPQTPNRRGCEGGIKKTKHERTAVDDPNGSLPTEFYHQKSHDTIHAVDASSPLICTAMMCLTCIRRGEK